MRPVWERLRSGWASLSGLFRPSFGVPPLYPAPRRRVLIVAATALVLAYAAGVLGYSLATPEIGVRTAFSPVVNYFEDDFRFAGEALRPGDRVVRVGNHAVANWSHFL